jgi:hypothetical protein
MVFLAPWVLERFPEVMRMELKAKGRGRQE